MVRRDERPRLRRGGLHEIAPDDEVRLGVHDVRRDALDDPRDRVSDLPRQAHAELLVQRPPARAHPVDGRAVADLLTRRAVPRGADDVHLVAALAQPAGEPLREAGGSVAVGWVGVGAEQDLHVASFLTGGSGGRRSGSSGGV